MMPGNMARIDPIQITVEHSFEIKQVWLNSVTVDRLIINIYDHLQGRGIRKCESRRLEADALIRFRDDVTTLHRIIPNMIQHYKARLIFLKQRLWKLLTLVQNLTIRFDRWGRMVVTFWNSRRYFSICRTKFYVLLAICKTDALLEKVCKYGLENCCQIEGRKVQHIVHFKTEIMQLLDCHRL